MSLPAMSSEERSKALDYAMRVRMERAAILRRVKNGKLTVADVLDMADKDESCARIKTKALIKAVPGYGDIRAEKLMKELKIAESRRLRGLGYKQRERLVEHFKDQK